MTVCSIISILFVVGVIAGTIDTIAGGGGILTVPAFLLTGLSPAQALATNKVQSICGTASAAYSFIRGGEIDVRSMWAILTCTLLGGLLGASVVQSVDPSILMHLVPWLLIAAIAYFLFSPRIGDIETRRRMPEGAFAVLAGLSLGFYDGFFGPGIGAFWALGLVSLLGRGLRRATAQAKILNLASNIGALSIFIWGGSLNWTYGLAMGLGQVFGARIGARAVMRRGTGLVRPLLVAISASITVKLLVTDDWSIVAQTFAALRHP